MALRPHKASKRVSFEIKFCISITIEYLGNINGGMVQVDAGKSTFNFHPLVWGETEKNPQKTLDPKIPIMQISVINCISIMTKVDYNELYSYINNSYINKKYIAI